MALIHQFKKGFKRNWKFSSNLRFASDESCSKRGPLDGIRVCDLTDMVSGPYCSMVLGDMGAEVVKVENTKTGDSSRSWGPSYLNDQSCYFLSINRNKKSICVDLTKPKGKEIIYKLVKKCDVFIENAISDEISNLGFGYDILSDINPLLIYCSISGYGLLGPLHKMAVDSTVSSALSGFMSITGLEIGKECVVGAPILDMLTALYASGAINAALYERNFSNCGKKIETSLLQTQMAYLCHIASAYLNADIVGKRYGTGHSSIAPYQGLKTADGMLVLAVGNDQQFKNTCKLLDLEYLLKIDKFKSNEFRTKNRKELISILEKKLVTKISSDWIKIFDEIGVPSGSSNSMKDVFSLPQVTDLDLIQEIQHPSLVSYKVAGPAIDFNGKSVLAPPSHAPLLGEHTNDILVNVLNFNEESVKSLYQENVVF